jgi:23S rRNA pseudouridine1911/1915/1917 synthase
MQTDFPVLFEDNHLLVVNKPAGILTQPSGTAQENLEDQAKAWLKIVHDKPGNVFLGTVHRLDKPVSGVVIFGKTSKALSRLNASIRAKLTHKLYYALVEGNPPSEGILENYVVHDDYHAEVAASDFPQAKLARLKYHVIEKRGDLTLLEIELETGRYHQIRLQFSHIGCPIAGDVKYGSRFPFEGRIALHHIKLEIPHPITGAICIFEAPLPPSFANFR